MDCSHLHHRNILSHFIILKNNLFSLLFIPPVITLFLFLTKKSVSKMLRLWIVSPPILLHFTPTVLWPSHQLHWQDHELRPQRLTPKLHLHPHFMWLFQEHSATWPLTCPPFFAIKNIFFSPVLWYCNKFGLSPYLTKLVFLNLICLPQNSGLGTLVFFFQRNSVWPKVLNSIYILVSAKFIFSDSTSALKSRLIYQTAYLISPLNSVLQTSKV